MLIYGSDANTRRAKKREVKSSGTISHTPGKHYYIIDPRQGKGQHSQVDIGGGEKIRLVNRLGFTEDFDTAARAAQRGCIVGEREKHFASGRAAFTLSDQARANYDLIDWGHNAQGSEVEAGS